MDASKHSNHYLIYKNKKIYQKEFDQMVILQKSLHTIRHAIIEFYMLNNENVPYVLYSKNNDANCKIPIKFPNLMIKCSRPFNKWLCVNVPTIAVKKNDNSVRLNAGTSFKIPKGGSGHYKISIKCCLTTNSNEKIKIPVEFGLCKINISVPPFQTLENFDNSFKYIARVSNNIKSIYFSDICYLSDDELYALTLQILDDISTTIYAYSFTVRFKRIHCIQKDIKRCNLEMDKSMLTINLNNYMSNFVRGTWGIGK